MEPIVVVSMKTKIITTIFVLLAILSFFGFNHIGWMYIHKDTIVSLSGLEFFAMMQFCKWAVSFVFLFIAICEYMEAKYAY